MSALENQGDKIAKAYMSADKRLNALEKKLQRKSNVEIYLRYDECSGVVVFCYAKNGGISLTEAVDIIERRKKLEESDFDESEY